MKVLRAFEESLRNALKYAVDELDQLVRNEHVYAFALFTSGEDTFSYVCASANTEEGLIESAGQYNSRDRRRSVTAKELRWSAPDWKYHDFCSAFGSVNVPQSDDEEMDAKIYDLFRRCLRDISLDQIPHADGAIYRAILCGDMSDEFLARGIKLLNSRRQFETYRNEYTAHQFIRTLKKLSPEKRLASLIELLRAFALNETTPVAEDARRNNMRSDLVERELIKFSQRAVPHLLGLVEEYGFGPVFNKKGTQEYEDSGAFTRANNLACRAALLIGKCKALSGHDITIAQRLIARRVAFDRAEPLASTLSENLARSLHRLCPERFPPSALNPRTSHLDNAVAFMP